MEISKIQEWKCHFPNMETILILEWIFYLPSLENGNKILFWIIYYPKLYFLLILSWILQFPFFSSPGYISVPGLEFVLTLTGYFLINQTWGNCTWFSPGHDSSYSVNEDWGDSQGSNEPELPEEDFAERPQHRKKCEKSNPVFTWFSPGYFLVFKKKPSLEKMQFPQDLVYQEISSEG